MQLQNVIGWPGFKGPRTDVEGADVAIPEGRISAGGIVYDDLPTGGEEFQLVDRLRRNTSDDMMISDYRPKLTMTRSG